jgi:hypothetical protein
MTTTRAALLYAGSTILLTAACLTAAPSHADDDLPLHHVKYTLTAKNPIYAQIYYLDQEPEVFAYWSHNPYQYMPNVEADLGPNHPAWTYEVDLHKPEEWAMVVANTGPEPGTPNFHCEIAVDGAVVVSQDGAKGVLCSIRGW